jgi:hypothetical protein
VTTLRGRSYVFVLRVVGLGKQTCMSDLSQAKISSLSYARGSLGLAPSDFTDKCKSDASLEIARRCFDDRDGLDAVRHHSGDIRFGYVIDQDNPWMPIII